MVKCFLLQRRAPTQGWAYYKSHHFHPPGTWSTSASLGLTASLVRSAFRSLVWQSFREVTYLSEGQCWDENQGLSGSKAHALNPWATQPSATVLCAFSGLCFPVAKGPCHPFSPVAGSWFTVGGSQSSTFPMDSLDPSVPALAANLVQGLQPWVLLMLPDERRWPWAQANLGCPQSVGKLSAETKKKCSPSRTVFVGLYFLMWRAHFLLICSQWQNQGEWEQGYFIYPKQFIKQTQGIRDSLWQIKVNSAPFVSGHTHKPFLWKVEEVILMFYGCLQATHAFLYFFLAPRVTVDLGEEGGK